MMPTILEQLNQQKIVIQSQLFELMQRLQQTSAAIDAQEYQIAQKENENQNENQDN